MTDSNFSSSEEEQEKILYWIDHAQQFLL